MSSAVSMFELDNLLNTVSDANARLFAIDTVQRYADQAALETVIGPYITVAESMAEVCDANMLRLVSKTAAWRADACEAADTTYWAYRMCSELVNPAPAHEWVKNLAHYALNAQAALDGGSAEQIAVTTDIEAANQIACLRGLLLKGG